MWKPPEVPANLKLPPLGLDVEYTHSRQRIDAAATILKYEKLVSKWLQEARPGSFFSRDGGVIYHEAHRLFTESLARKSYYDGNTLDNFEVCLSRLGYRAGVLVHQGRSLWMLLLPSAKVTPVEKARQEKTLDQAFRDLIDGEALSAADVDGLLTVLANHS